MPASNTIKVKGDKDAYLSLQFELNFEADQDQFTYLAINRGSKADVSHILIHKEPILGTGIANWCLNRVAFKDLAWLQNPAIFPDFQPILAIFSGYFSD